MLELLNIKIEVERLSNILAKAEDCLDLQYLTARIQYLHQVIAQPDFWNNPTRAYEVLQEIEYSIFYKHQQYQRWCSILEDIKAALELLELSADEQLWQEVQSNLTQLQQELETAEIRQLLSGLEDKKGAFITITAGVGGVDAEYWAYMLLQMYWRWAKSHNYQLDVVEISDGNEAGIKYATLEITTRYAYGYLKSETGTHQLQQISPFDVINSLQTSLASVEVIPILGESVEWEIPEKHLEITWYRHRGSVNRPETWVRVFHIPTGISVFCDQQRSLMQNKEKALAILKSKLFAMPTAGYAYALAQGVEIDKIQHRQIKSLSNKLIREYILHPYTLVKDLRTNVERPAAAEVLDGKIDLFIKAYLQQLYLTSSGDKEVLDNFK
ncbi:PCRF domain-containing protein [Nostoc sp. UCD121]|uniref:PCRF domain-containing protein n=1 Tax=unclassified Nostoc TaxID=2593658 RepID=UPI001626139E|nr:MULTISPECIES: PCRF domain-containing protein [unclassified Nostoc]MBC1223992.1 PCRF domain-containing protein [Nostoc sp. UCD120]MBC1274658.1 PCRF domain-containing protein [Nostoc sp. UCD121]MBC1293745.1 PCRF domain-containing protein [Nostoc sp. UCD122]